MLLNRAGRAQEIFESSEIGGCHLHFEILQSIKDLNQAIFCLTLLGKSSRFTYVAFAKI